MSVTIKNSQIDKDFNIQELTDGTLNGTGVFDVLMDSVKAHLWVEFDKNRIRGTDYANAYIRAMEVALQTSTQYALGKAKLGAELTILEKQANKLDKEIDFVDKQMAKLDSEIAHTVYQDGLTQAQTRQVNQETKVLEAKLPKELTLLDDQHSQLLAQTAMTVAQTATQKEQTKLVTANTALVGANKANTEAQTSSITTKLPKELVLLDAQNAQTSEQTKAIAKQVLQTEAQTQLVQAQTATERKQTEAITANVGLTQAQSTAISQKLPKELLILDGQKYQMAEQSKVISKQIAQTQAQTDLTNAQVRTEVKQLDVLTANIGLTNAQSASINQKLPKELLILDSQKAMTDSQKSMVDTQRITEVEQAKLITANIANVTANKANTEAQTSAINQKLPKELLLMTAQTTMVTNQATHETARRTQTEAQTALIGKQREEIDYNIRSLKPQELRVAQAEVRLKEKQADTMTKELELKTAQVGLHQYELSNVKPVELDIAREKLKLGKEELKEKFAQTEFYKQKTITEKANTDGSVIKAGSVIEKNNAVLQKQADNYDNDSKLKMANIMADIWKIHHTNAQDQAVPNNATNGLGATNIRSAMQNAMTSVGARFNQT
ncbi:hypothetical protein [Moraxella sp. ZY200743]|uniref:hypothetical protein n=1 Tax=Moraxella sp. ZY200743 TaxID=2911970 RepID=UPI003D7DF34F